MNIWQKITATLKFAFGGFEAAADYVLGIVNKWVEDSGYGEKVIEVSQKCMKVLTWLKEHESWCPPKWNADFIRILCAISTLVTAGDDGKLTTSEIKAVADCWRTAYVEWNKEDPKPEED